MSRLVLTAALLQELRERLLAGPEEACAVLYGRAIQQNGALVRLVVREALYPAPDDYSARTRIAAELKPEFVAKVGQRVRRSGESAVFVHSHPFEFDQFSATDNAGEQALAAFFRARTPDTRHAAMLVTPTATLGRELGAGAELAVCGVGETLAFGNVGVRPESSEHFDRQVRMFGAAGQATLGSLRVGIVGLGGTGSVVAEQLAHLGVRDFCLIDPDTVEPSNLNRLVGGRPSDVGRLKVEVAERHIRSIAPGARVEPLEESVLKASGALRLLAADFVFACTDSQGSRSVLNQLAYQYLIPIVDVGVSIVVSANRITHVAGRANMLAPGLGCFVCGNLLDPEAVRVDLLTDFERKNDPYVMGAREPAPAVISLNSTVSSMAVTMFLQAALGLPGACRFINYNGLTGSARPAAISRHPTCVVCSDAGGLARASEWPSPGRLA